MNTRSALLAVGVTIGIAGVTAAFVGVARHVAAQPADATFATIEGTVEADEVNVAPKIPGRVKMFTPQEGDEVHAGDVIAVLESGEITAKVKQASNTLSAQSERASGARVGANLQYQVCRDQLSQADSALAASRAKLAEAVHGARSQEKVQAQANFDAAQARLDEALKGARPQEIEQVRKAVEQAAAVHQTAKATYERFSGLYKEGVIPRQKQDEIEMQYLSSRAAYEGAKAKLSLVVEGTRSEQIRQARAAVEAAKAQLALVHEGTRSEQIEQARAGEQSASATVALAKHNMALAEIRRLEASAAVSSAKAAEGGVDEARSVLRETLIIAPVSGYISQKIANAGEMVAAGYPIATIVKRDDYKVKVYADESKFGYLRLHAPIQVQIPALPSQTCQGELTRIAQAADFATKKATNEQGSVDVRAVELVIRIPHPPALLRNGMTARVRLECAPQRSR